MVFDIGFDIADTMAIYKQKIGQKSANVRQGIFWGLLGFIGGIYCFQPLLKALHREEQSALSDYFQVEGTRVVELKTESKTTEDSSKPTS